jgi:hypothetical protein
VSYRVKVDAALGGNSPRSGTRGCSRHARLSTVRSSRHRSRRCGRFPCCRPCRQAGLAPRSLSMPTRMGESPGRAHRPGRAPFGPLHEEGGAVSSRKLEDREVGSCDADRGFCVGQAVMWCGHPSPWGGRPGAEPGHGAAAPTAINRGAAARPCYEPLTSRSNRGLPLSGAKLGSILSQPGER